MSSVADKFLNYVKIDTQSVNEMDQVPSSEKQRKLASLLAEELRTMGAEDVKTDEHSYVYATIPATTERKVPVLGFVAHMDTAPDCSGADVKPQIIKNYDGGDILLNKAASISMTTEEFPYLSQLKGLDLITTDGTTLLGADDKAGVAEIMAMAEYLITHKEISHGTIKIAFTPDEEVGRGSDFFDVEGFGADAAYTVDGGPLGDLEYETFNAAGVKVTINGFSIHTGSAKGRMRNAMLLAMEFQTLLPAFENPMYTEGYEGFYHLNEIHGNVEKTVMRYLLRDHDKTKFQQKKDRIEKTAAFLNEKYGNGTISLELKDSYYNMKEKLSSHMYLIDIAKSVMEEMEIIPLINPVRGGTDGARLSYMGLPCPNLGTGGYNFHGRYEFIPIQSMEKTVELLIGIVKKFEKR